MTSKKNKVILVDKDDKILGYKEKFSVHKNPAQLHRAVSVLIFDAKKKMLLIQKRSKYKKTWPMHWTNTVCGDVLQGETHLRTAKRRLKEEMGIQTKLRPVFSFTYSFKYDKTWGECEIDHVFSGIYEGPINPDPNEASGYEWIELSKLKKYIKKTPDKYTPWFKIILEKI